MQWFTVGVMISSYVCMLECHSIQFELALSLKLKYPVSVSVSWYETVRIREFATNESWQQSFERRMKSVVLKSHKFDFLRMPSEMKFEWILYTTKNATCDKLSLFFRITVSVDWDACLLGGPVYQEWWRSGSLSNFDNQYKVWFIGIKWVSYPE